MLELAPAELDEDLFAKYGVEEGGEEQFRKEVGENMARELKNAIQGKLKQQVMDSIAGSAPVTGSAQGAGGSGDRL